MGFFAAGDNGMSSTLGWFAAARHALEPWLVAGAAVATLHGGSAFAQDYPAHPARIIVPFAAGGPADVYARFIGQRLQEALGQGFVIDNRPGAGSIIGTDAVTYASSGPGTPYHMAGELFKAMAGVSIVHIPYKGSSGARTDVLGGQVDMMFDAITTMTEHARAGKVKALATTGRTRSAVMPDVPTLHEAGVPGFEATIWLGLLAPRGTPPAVVNRLNAEVSRIVSQPEVRRAWEAQGATTMVMTVDEFGRYLNDDIVKWAHIVKVSGAKAEQ